MKKNTNKCLFAPMSFSSVSLLSHLCPPLKSSSTAALLTDVESSLSLPCPSSIAGDFSSDFKSLVWFQFRFYQLRATSVISVLTSTYWSEDVWKTIKTTHKSNQCSLGKSTSRSSFQDCWTNFCRPFSYQIKPTFLQVRIQLIFMGIHLFFI